MNDASKIPGNLLATKVDPPGPATWISHKWRMFIAELLTCLMNPHITLLYLDESGAATLSKDAEIVMGPAGWTATLDLTGLGGSGGTPTGATVAGGTFVSDGGDYIVVTPSAGGSNVNVAKPPKLRCSITTDTQIDGTGVHTYTYNAVIVGGVIVAYTRTNTWNSGINSETEDITPAYLVGDLVYYINMPTINMPVSPGSGTTVAVTLLDIHEHDWCV